MSNAGSLAHAALATTITTASKTITLLNRVAIAGYYTHAVTIQHTREGNPDYAYPWYGSGKIVDMRILTIAFTTILLLEEDHVQVEASIQNEARTDVKRSQTRL